jgi:hypothetical protein
MSLDDYRSEFDTWVDMWDEIQEKYPEPKVKKAPIPPSDGDAARDQYYGYLDETEPEMLSEETKKFVNPVYPDSVGPDSETTPPAWADEEIVDKIKKFKDQLFELENQVAEKMGGGKKWQEKPVDCTAKSKASKKIQSLQEKIEKLSSTLGIDKEAKPWFDKE